MQLLLVRHARAKDRDEFAASGKPDSARPRTKKGIRKMRAAARGLRALVPSIELLVSSPLRRAVQTAEIIAEVFEKAEYVEREELKPGASPQRLIEWLARRKADGIVCIVGHEPDLSELLAELLGDQSKAPAALKKGSAALVKIDGAIVASGGRLQWYHTAKELASHVA
jgi:phosphohistidine phosphatase